MNVVNCYQIAPRRALSQSSKTSSTFVPLVAAAFVISLSKLQLLPHCSRTFVPAQFFYRKTGYVLMSCGSQVQGLSCKLCLRPSLALLTLVSHYTTQKHKMIPRTRNARCAVSCRNSYLYDVTARPSYSAIQLQPHPSLRNTLCAL